MFTLVISGGAASRKSEYAGKPRALPGSRIYVATMQPFDAECRGASAPPGAAAPEKTLKRRWNATRGDALSRVPASANVTTRVHEQSCGKKARCTARADMEHTAHCGRRGRQLSGVAPD